MYSKDIVERKYGPDTGIVLPCSWVTNSYINLVNSPGIMVEIIRTVVLYKLTLAAEMVNGRSRTQPRSIVNDR